MRWIAYFILAYVALGVQAGVGASAQVGQAQPNFGLLAAIFIALHAPREPALLGCFIMGLLQDVLTVHPLGLHALGYGMVGMVVMGARAVVYREHALTHVMLALAGGIILGLVIVVHGWLRGPAVPVGTVVLSIVYTAAIAPLLMWLLRRVKKVFAFQAPRRRLA
jgi:rod shape-determining protein MreD